MNRETDDRTPGKRPPERILRWVRRGFLVAVLLIFAAVLSAGSLWHYRAPVLAWILKNRIEARGARAELEVAAVETDRLVLKDIRIGGATTLSIRSMVLDYRIERMLAGPITAVRATGIALRREDFHADVDSIAGSGSFALGLMGLRRLQADLDVIGATLAGEPTEPSRLHLNYSNDRLAFETIIPSAHGYVAILGEGSLAEGASPFAITLSGQVDANLIPYLEHVNLPPDDVAFTVSTKISDVVSLVDTIRTGQWRLPDRFSADAELQFDLGRLRIDGYAFGLPGRDRVRIRLDDLRTRDNATEGRIALDIGIGPRRSPESGFARASLSAEASIRLFARTLDVALHSGAELSIVDLESSNGVRLTEKTTLQLVDESNRISIDLARRTARHRLHGRLVRKHTDLRLQSEGHLSAPDDPIVFMLQGKADTAPVLALLSPMTVESGIGEIFLAGEVVSLLPDTDDANGTSPPAPTTLRLDGAAILRLVGASAPGVTKSDDSAESLTLSLKGFEASRNWRQGRFSLTASVSPRQFGQTSIQSATLAVDGQFRSTGKGYRMRLAPGSMLDLRKIRSPLLALSDSLRLQLAGDQNMIETDANFLPVMSQLELEDLEATGAFIGKEGFREPFKLSFPSIRSNYDGVRHEIRTTTGDFTLPAASIAAKDIALDARIEGSEASFKITAADVRHRARRPLLSPVAIAAQAKLQNRKLTASIRARQLRTPFAGTATLRHDFGQQSGQLRFKAPRVNLESRHHRFGDIFPIALGWFDHVSGGLSAEGELNWDRDLFSGRAAVTTDRVNLALQDLRVIGMNGALAFVELKPLVMPPRQRFTGKLAFADIGPLPFRLEIQLNEDGSIAVQDLEIEVGGGNIRTRGTLAAQGGDLSVSGKAQITSVALQEMLRMLGIDGVQAAGRVTGSFPIELRNNAAKIAGGRLSADGPGRLQYRGDALRLRLVGTPGAKTAALRTLRDFRYDQLSMELNDAGSGIGIVTLRMKGSNPAVYDGATFDFDLRIAGDLRRLERLALGGLQTSADVSRQADER